MNSGAREMAQEVKCIRIRLCSNPQYTHKSCWEEVVCKPSPGLGVGQADPEDLL